MKTYWDLQEHERAALSQEDVKRYVDAELMLKGVLKVAPLVLEVEPTIPKPSTTLFVIRTTERRYGSKSDVIAFRDEVDVGKFLALTPIILGSEYVNGHNINVSAPMRDPEVAKVDVFDADELLKHRATVEQAHAIREKNQKAVAAYEAAEKTVRVALKGLWEDWAEQRDEHARLEKIAATFADYQSTAGDDVTASKFLNKVFKREDIHAAQDRFAFDYVRDAEFEEAAPEPAFVNGTHAGGAF